MRRENVYRVVLLGVVLLLLYVAASRPNVHIKLWFAVVWSIVATITIIPEAAHGLWARTSETAFSGAIQQFEEGWLFWDGNVCFVLFSDGTWTMF